MTHPDERIRESLRDLIPGYQGPADPYTRVGVAIRRRRSRQRVLIAISTMSAVVAVLIAVPLVLRGRPGGDAPAGSGRRAGGEAGPGPVGSGQQVAAGTNPAGAWTVRAVRLSSGAHRCLYADDVVFQQAALCFDDWPAKGPVSWASVTAIRPEAPASAVFGVAATTIGSVIVVFSDGSQQTVPAVASPDEPDTRFFALVVNTPRLTVRNVTTLANDRTLVQLAVSRSATAACRPSRTDPCTRPTG
ncbi:MAG TPA: hypothetical protein VMU51_06100 [Mycobacteriales bacterium]|nr:hypothetical protein [Mycobacteriales bacterium]